MATYTSTATLLSAINRKIESCMKQIDSTSMKYTNREITDFYTEGDPKYYKRTFTYRDTPTSTGVTGGGNHYELEIYLNPSGHGYRTGTFSAERVWQAIENHTDRVQGKPHRWQNVEDDIRKTVDETFSRYFTRIG